MHSNLSSEAKAQIERESRVYEGLAILGTILDKTEDSFVEPKLPPEGITLFELGDIFPWTNAKAAQNLKSLEEYLVKEFADDFGVALRDAQDSINSFEDNFGRRFESRFSLDLEIDPITRRARVSLKVDVEATQIPEEGASLREEAFSAAEINSRTKEPDSLPQDSGLEQTPFLKAARELIASGHFSDTVEAEADFTLFRQTLLNRDPLSALDDSLKLWKQEYERHDDGEDDPGLSFFTGLKLPA
jgi:hypothetical protein